MRIYYLDAPLEAKELEQLRMAVTGPTAPVDLRQVRVPCVLPAAEGATVRGDAPTEPLLRLALRNLRRAGLEKDIGQQVGWVMPRDPQRTELMQAAIRRLTGFHPIAIQRWREQPDGTLARTPLCVIDLHGMREMGTTIQQVP